MTSVSDEVLSPDVDGPWRRGGGIGGTGDVFPSERCLLLPATQESIKREIYFDKIL